MDDEKRQKRMKWAAYITAFAIFQVIVILVFALVIMKVRTPKFRVGNFEIQSLSTNTTPAPSFDMAFVAPIRVKNANFGPYKYDATTVDFTYGGAMVGQVQVPKSKANFRSTKKIDVLVNLSSSVSNVVPDISSGTLTLSSSGTMTGKVEMMLIFKKKKSTSMNCTMVINLASKVLQSLNCK
ncbi:hypothetical protein MLD38_018496 [Melastoma candidum]|uniref:Uncharacterized protein n=1 Tax=Melastoma candidum TaxID=119954 RepID=A0ACB9QUI8_9MYRT|nr:hypothetical protein MLD38_018496 [Melastoma candidum]